MREPSLKDDALFVAVLLTIGAAPAAAQQTPQTYCASLPATSCEVLNVELSFSGSAYIILVKECLNQHFATRIISVNGSAVAAYVINGTQATTVAPSMTTWKGSTSLSGFPVLDFSSACF